MKNNYYHVINIIPETGDYGYKMIIPEGTKISYINASKNRLEIYIAADSYVILCGMKISGMISCNLDSGEITGGFTVKDGSFRIDKIHDNNKNNFKVGDIVNFDFQIMPVNFILGTTLSFKLDNMTVSIIPDYSTVYNLSVEQCTDMDTDIKDFLISFPEFIEPSYNKKSTLQTNMQNWINFNTALKNLSKCSTNIDYNEIARKMNMYIPSNIVEEFINFINRKKY